MKEINYENFMEIGPKLFELREAESNNLTGHINNTLVWHVFLDQ